jgi:sugar phosphate isomerase/epimerase
VISESGTFNADSDWVHDDKNKTQEGYETCLAQLDDLRQTAYDHGATFLLETYVNNVIGSLEETMRVFNDFKGKPGIELLMDPTNYFEIHNIDAMQQILNDVFDNVADRVRIAHAKDVKRSGDDKSEKHADLGADLELESHTFRGVGELDYDLYVRRLSEVSPNVPLIIEHLDESDVPRAKRFVDDVLKRNGV